MASIIVDLPAPFDSEKEESWTSPLIRVRPLFEKASSASFTEKNLFIKTLSKVTFTELLPLLEERDPRLEWAYQFFEALQTFPITLRESVNLLYPT